jgi:hypothetical protein
MCTHILFIKFDIVCRFIGHTLLLCMLLAYKEHKLESFLHPICFFGASI